MEDLRRNTLVGGFLIVGLLALAWLMTSFGELPEFLGSSDYELLMVVKDPSGIGEGAPIFLSGVQIGRVRELRFKDVEHLDAGVQIVGAIKKEFRIPSTATALVQPAGLGLGRGQIDLRVKEGAAPPLAEGVEILGEMGNPWGDMIPDTLLATIGFSAARFGDFMAQLTPVARDLHDLLERHTVADVDADTAGKLTSNISTVVERFDQTLKTFNETFGHPDVKKGWLELFENVRVMSEDGRAALADVRQTSGELRADLKRISVKLERGIDNTTITIDELAADIRPFLQNLSHLSSTMLRIATAMEEGEGTAGRFLTDPKLYESLVMTSERLTEMIDTIQRLFAKFERQGAIDVGKQTSIGTFRKKIDIPESSSP